MAPIRENRPDLTVPQVCLRVHHIEHGLAIRMGRFKGGHCDGRLEDLVPRFSNLFPQPLGDADKLRVELDAWSSAQLSGKWLGRRWART